MNFLAFDLADWKELNQLCQKINEPLDGIVLNAGGMPESFLTNEFGVELQMASQLFGHYFLIRKLKELGKLTKGAGIVWVSSGGMYLTRLQKDYIFKNKDYNKVSTYANVKKAQVALLNTIKEEFSDQVLVGMHPGWVETPGLKASISDFYQKMANRLRSPAEGADTIVWLLGRNKAPVAGEFYFDRRPARKDLFFNKVKQSDRDFFMELLNKYYEELN